MLRRAAPTIPLEWTLVTRSRPCRVCGSPLGCRCSSDGEFACCTTQPSEWPLTVGGWVHSVAKTVAAPQRS